jgi:hypothetical protein
MGDMRVGYLWLTFIYHNHYIQSGVRCNERFHRFALIELLVVIAILASLLLPLSIAREDSRRAVCQSQLKQLYLGLCMHNDGNGRLLTMQTEPGETITILPRG